MVVETIRRLEGGQVCVALKGGARFDDCQLVAAPRGGVSDVWLFIGGSDVFVPAADIIEVWEAS